VTAVKYILKGLQESRNLNLERIRNLTGKGAMGDIIIDVTGELFRRLVLNTPYETTILRNSRREKIDLTALTGEIYTAGVASYPNGKVTPAQVDVYLSKRGYKPGLRAGIQSSMAYTVEHNRTEMQKRAANSLLKVLVKQ
jgi:hypothetical protein